MLGPLPHKETRLMPSARNRNFFAECIEKLPATALPYFAAALLAVIKTAQTRRNHGQRGKPLPGGRKSAVLLAPAPWLPAFFNGGNTRQQAILPVARKRVRFLLEACDGLFSEPDGMQTGSASRQEGSQRKAVSCAYDVMLPVASFVWAFEKFNAAMHRAGDAKCKLHRPPSRLARHEPVLTQAWKKLAQR